MNNNYKEVIEFCKLNNIKFAVVSKETEITPTVDLNGFDLIDTETFEIPSSFEVERAIIVCIDTPKDLTPEDTGKSYDTYHNTVNRLRYISRPQYIGVDGSYVKLMVWCEWAGENDPKKEFTDACKEAVNKAVCNCGADVDETDLRFGIAVGGTELGFTCLASDKGIDEMYDWIRAITDWDWRLYIKDKNQFTEHGVRCDKLCGMRVVTVY